MSTPSSFRRSLVLALAASPALLLPGAVLAQSSVERALGRLGATRGAGALNQSDAAGGIKEALAQGVDRSIRQLGRPDGFFRDAAVKILVPERIRQIADIARRAGQGARVDAFEESMNRAAEKAVPSAAGILGDAVRGMSIQDAIGLVRGGETSATDFFRRAAGDKLFSSFRPIVVQQTASVGVTQKYKAFADRAGGGALGALLGGGGRDGRSALDLDDYVTNKSIDGLFHVIAGQERQIRSNPAARNTDLLRRVFG
ncbi:MAG: DUF4197 domain-containing protein [Silanimonas sp.]